MLLTIILSTIIAIVIISTLNFQGYGAVERSFQVLFKNNEDNILEQKTYPLVIRSRRINNFLLILAFSICIICLLTIYIQNGFLKLFCTNIFMGCLLFAPIIILVLIIMYNICIFTNKLKLYPNKIICSNIFKRKTFFYQKLNAIELFNYLDAYYKLGFDNAKRPQSRHAYHITKNGKILKKLWGHHYKDLYTLENYFSSKCPYVKHVKKSKKINENTIMPLTFLTSLK